MKIINDKSSARHTYVCVNYNHLGRIKAFIYYKKTHIISTCEKCMFLAFQLQQLYLPLFVNFAKPPVTLANLVAIILASIIVQC